MLQQLEGGNDGPKSSAPPLNGCDLDQSSCGDTTWDITSHMDVVPTICSTDWVASVCPKLSISVIFNSHKDL